MQKIVVFVSGAVLMALEIVGSRILAPSFGSSIFVWGSLISIFLAALSIGYFLGGRLSDRYPSTTVLAGMIAAAGILVATLPWYAGSINDWITGADLGPRASPLLASFILFFIPSIFMGTVTPFSIKLEARNLATVGNTAGQLSAISTGGSIVGTLLSSFYLIPAMGVRSIVHTLGLILLALAVVLYAMSFTRRPPASIKPRSDKAKPNMRSLIIGALLAGTTMTATVHHGAVEAASQADTTVIYKKDSAYHHIQVVDRGRVRHLHFDNSYQSAMYLDDPDRMVFKYTEYLHLGMVFAPHAKRSLFVGLGGGSAPKRFLRDYPNLHIDVAEIDPEVIAVGKRFFAVPDNHPRLKLYAQDGRTFLRSAHGQGPYDLAVIDAYFADSIPFHLTTREYLQELDRKLTPNGVVVANIIGAMTGDRSRLFRSMYKTYQAVFPQVYIFPVEYFPHSDHVLRNIILVATKNKQRLSPGEIRAAIAQMQSSGFISIDLSVAAADYREFRIHTDGVPILTDDYAPVDSLQHF